MKVQEVIADEYIDFNHQADIEGELISISLTHNKEIIYATALKPFENREEINGASFVKVKTDNTQSYHIYQSQNGEMKLMAEVHNEPFNIHHIQPLPNNQWLLASARCSYRDKDNYDKNGRIYSQQGELINSILLGDGIEAIQTTQSGKIWTSYFDEGVFGNYGWGDVNNPPIGASGLVEFDQIGKKSYEFDTEGYELDTICDCYALNVTSENNTWFYYYTDFVLVNVKNQKIQDYWQMPVSGSRQIVISQPFVLTIGSYDDAQQLSLFKLEKNHQVKHLKNIKISNIENINFFLARDDMLIIFAGGKAYRLFMSQLM